MGPNPKSRSGRQGFRQQAQPVPAEEAGARVRWRDLRDEREIGGAPDLDRRFVDTQSAVEVGTDRDAMPADQGSHALRVRTDVIERDVVLRRSVRTGAEE